jgi:predicted nucleic acid-binding Zn ribbon protein
MTKCRNHYPRELRCYVCGTIVTTSGSKTMCDECRELRRQERQRARARNYTYKLCPGSYMVIFDPDINYGFHAGAIFDGEDIKAMLCPVMSAFTPGTRLQNHSGDIFVVKRKARGGEELILT